MSVAVTFHVVARSCDALDITPEGRVVAAGLHPRLSVYLAEHEPVVRWGIVAARSGHAWRTCTKCRECAIGSAKGKATKCRMTPRCSGDMVLLHQLHEGEPCERPGCTWPAPFLNIYGERLCVADVALSALLTEESK